MLTSFPILTRAYRTHWRRPQFFLWLFALSVPCAFVFVLTYANSVVALGAVETKFDEAGDNLWLILAWLQTALALFVAPALGAGAIARERERGLLEGLILAPLAPARIVLEKWLGVMAPLLLIFVTLAPFSVLATSMRQQGTATLSSVWGYQLLLVCASAAIGIACSAWARRAHLAIRSAYGLVTLWVLVSGAAALLSGIKPVGAPAIRGYIAPFYIRWIGQTNPLLGAYDLIMSEAGGAYWPSASATLLAILALCFWSATRGLRKPLAQIPFIGDGKKAKVRKKGASAQASARASAPDHFEVPLVGAWHFANPVLGREVRSKFRLRQPPLGVIIAEIILALLVAVFYLRTLWTAFTDPSVRGIIFGGVTITGFIVTLIGCLIMGANGFSREHEGGTWESLRLSLLRPREIIRGKAFGIGLTCLLFSLPVWPLLLPCVGWGEMWESANGSDGVAISSLISVFVIWSGSVATATLWGLWWGRRTRKTSSASGAALGTGALWFAALPLLWLGLADFDHNAEVFLVWFNPFGALFQSDSASYGRVGALGLPFLAFSIFFALAVAAALERAMKREFG